MPIWKVPVFTRPQPSVQDVSEGSGMCGLWQKQSWGTGKQPLTSLLEAALSCYCPKLPTPPFPYGLVLPQQNLHLNCLFANPQAQPWPLEGHRSLWSCCSTWGLSPWIQHGEPSSPAARWNRLLGKGTSVCDSEIHQYPFHHRWVFTGSAHTHTHISGDSLAPQALVSFSQGYQATQGLICSV